MLEAGDTMCSDFYILPSVFTFTSFQGVRGSENMLSAVAYQPNLNYLHPSKLAQRTQKSE